MPKNPLPLFHILPRNAQGGLTNAAKDQLRKSRVDLTFQREETKRVPKETAAVLSAFRKLLPERVILAESSPFLILSSPRVAAGSLAAQCKCQCSVTSDCGGGGGGGGSITS